MASTGDISDIWANKIHEQGFMGVVDKFWLILQRLNTLCVFVCILTTIIVFVSGMLPSDMITKVEGFASRNYKPTYRSRRL